jgi:ACS family D-galactonate transporter-like MFS transporter
MSHVNVHTEEEKLKATTVRWRIFIVMLILGAINYIDRTSLSIAMPYITDEFGITDTRVVGVIHSAFFWAYALMQIPSGVIADKFKARNIIAIATILWVHFRLSPPSVILFLPSQFHALGWVSPSPPLCPRAQN